MTDIQRIDRSHSRLAAEVYDRLSRRPPRGLGQGGGGGHSGYFQPDGVARLQRTLAELDALKQSYR